MKTTSTFAVFLFILVSNLTLAQVRWGVNAGLDFSTVLSKDREGQKAATAAVPGINLKLGANVPIVGDFSLQPAVVYARRGFKAAETTSVGWGNDFVANVSYVELPVDVAYTRRLGVGSLFVGVGPYVGYGLGGKWRAGDDVAIGDIVIGNEGDVKFQNDASHQPDMNTHVYARPWDYGAHVKIGYTFLDNYTVQFDLQHGVADLQPNWGDYDPDGALRNRSVGVSVGYRF